jgi:hypothetical protein
VDNMGTTNFFNTMNTNNINRILKISAIIFFTLLCLPYSNFSKKFINREESNEQGVIMDKIKYLFLRYGGIVWIFYIILMGVLSYYEPGVAVMGILFFLMVFTWDPVSDDNWVDEGIIEIPEIKDI